MINTQQLGLSFIPGPKQIESPCYSTEIQDFTKYTPQEIADSFISLEGFRLLTSEYASWWDWKGSWMNEGYEIDVNITCIGQKDEIWGGSELFGICPGTQILRLWNHLVASGLSFVYLHNHECRVFTREEFEAEMCVS